MSNGADGARSSTSELHVLVVAYGPADQLHEALSALGGGYPVTVVDNSSSARTAEVVHGAGARYLDPGRNLGFAAAVNLALGHIDLARHDVLLLNPDARIEPSDLERMRTALNDSPDIACAAPSHRSPGSSSSHEPWWPWNTPWGAWVEAAGLHKLRRHGYLSGAVLLVRGRAFDDVGGLDERFFLYAEDEDWQRRALRRGWHLSHCTEAVALHTAGATDSDLTRQRARLHAATEQYVRKWYGPMGWNLYRAAVLVGQGARLAVYWSIRRRPNSRWSAANLLHLYAAGPEREALRTGVLPRAQRART